MHLFVLPWGALCRQAGSRQGHPQPKERKEQGPVPLSGGRRRSGRPSAPCSVAPSGQLSVHYSSPRGSPERLESRAGGMRAEHARVGSSQAFVCLQGVPLCLWLERACAHAGICPAGEDISLGWPVSGYCLCTCAHTRLPLVLRV